MTTLTLEKFLDDVKHHEITIHQNNGVYRHLEFKKTDNSNPYFNITTFPNHLVITGSINGCNNALVFSKQYDMFDYFYQYLGDNDLKIYPQLWHEIILSTSYKGIIESYSEFDIDEIKRCAQEDLDDFIKNAELSAEDVAALRWEFESNVLNAEYEHEIIDSITNFDRIINFGFCGFNFDEFWESNYRKYRYEYIWLCYAIVWGIKKFDELNKE